MEADVNLDDFVECNAKGEPDLSDLDADDLQELCEELNCCGYTEDSDEDELKAAITRRCVDELEPIIQVKHYMARNKGKPGKDPWLQCGDPAAAVNAQDWNFETECLTCFERMQGDKGISSQTLYTWSIYGTSRQHRVPNKKKGEKDTYETCTMRSKKRCQHCAHNRRIDSREQRDIPKEELANLIKDEGYHRVYTGGMSRLELPETNLSQIEDLEMQVKEMCRSCSKGDLVLTGATCPGCEEEFDFEELIGTGWDPDVFDREKVGCRECNELVQPVCVYECDNCNNPVPARLGDVLVRAKMTFEGANNKRIWTFNLAGRPQIFGLDEDDDMDDIIKEQLPDYETITAAPDMKVQIKQVGCGHNTITGEEADEEDAVPSAPTTGRAGKIAKNEGTKSVKEKGGKTKIGRVKSVKAGGAKVKRKSGFLRKG